MDSLTGSKNFIPHYENISGNESRSRRLSLTVRVLYSDGWVGILSKEEAERLIFEQSLRPIMFNDIIDRPVMDDL